MSHLWHLECDICDIWNMPFYKHSAAHSSNKDQPLIGKLFSIKAFFGWRILGNSKKNSKRMNNRIWANFPTGKIMRHQCDGRTDYLFVVNFPWFVFFNRLEYSFTKGWNDGRLDGLWWRREDSASKTFESDHRTPPLSPPSPVETWFFFHHCCPQELSTETVSESVYFSIALFLLVSMRWKDLLIQ